MRMLAIILLAATSITGGCSEFEGPLPPDDGLYYPVGVAIHPNGEVIYVANANFDAGYRVDIGGTVVAVDAATLEILSETTIRIGSFAGGIALNGGDADNPDKLFVAVRGDNSIVALDVSPDGRTIGCGGELDALDCRIRSLPDDPFAVVSMPGPYDADGNALAGVDLIAVASMNGSVSYITLDDGRVEDAHIESRGIVSGASVSSYFPPSDQLWVGGRFSRRLRGLRHVYAPDTNGEVAELLVETEALFPSTLDSAEVRDMAFSPDFDRAYVTANRPASILVLDMTLDDDGEPRATVLERFDLDGAPAQLLVTSEANREVLYVALSNDEAIAVVDAETGILLDRIALGGLVYSLTYDEGSGRLFASIFDDHEVAVLDLVPSSPTFRQIVGRIR